MDDKAHVRFVDAHAESDGGYDHVHFLHQEGILVAGAGFGVQTGMVRGGGNAVYAQQFGEFLHLFAREAVDDA